MGHLDGRDSQGPYIRLEVVPSLLDYLRCHPKGSSDESVALGFDVCQLCSDTEVCKLNLAGLGQEDICSLDIAVNLAFGVKVLETEQQLPAYYGDMLLGEVPGFELRRRSAKRLGK